MIHSSPFSIPVCSPSSCHLSSLPTLSRFLSRLLLPPCIHPFPHRCRHRPAFASHCHSSPTLCCRLRLYLLPWMLSPSPRPVSIPRPLPLGPITSFATSIIVSCHPPLLAYTCKDVYLCFVESTNSVLIHKVTAEPTQRPIRQSRSYAANGFRVAFHLSTTGMSACE
jgi:hypothetical protein